MYLSISFSFKCNVYFMHFNFRLFSFSQLVTVNRIIPASILAVWHHLLMQLHFLANQTISVLHYFSTTICKLSLNTMTMRESSELSQ